MHIERFPSNVSVIGFIVKTFPEGIGDAFRKLQQMLRAGDTRTFYGLSRCSGSDIIYKAAAMQLADDEASKYGLDTYTVPKGDYLAVTVFDWMKDTSQIRATFESIGDDPVVDRSSELVEVYKNHDEMVCMVRADRKKLLARDVEDATSDFINAVSNCPDEMFNFKSSPEGWSIGQVAEHLRKAHAGMHQLITAPATTTNRDPAQWMETIKNDLLNFGQKRKSPESVRPEDKQYDKYRHLAGLQKKLNEIIETIHSTDPEEKCSGFSFPAYGELTRMEVCQFMTYHARRHAQQVKALTSQYENTRL